MPSYVLRRAAGARALGLRAAGDGVPAEARAEVQLGPGDPLRLQVLGPSRLEHARRRRHHEPAAARVDQVATLPALVRDPLEVELAGRDEHLLLAPVEHVPVDVEVVDRQPGLRATVDLEARQHLGRVEQPHVLQWTRVALDRRRVQRTERDLRAHDVVEVDPHRGSRRLHVALDVGLLARLLVRVDDE